MTDEVLKDQIEEGNEDTRIYEAAFHVIPTLEEAEAAGVAAELRSQIESKGGSILGGDAPQMMHLAYPIQKDIDRKRHTYTSGYFGWIVFESTGDVAHAIKETLGGMKTILRSLVVKTTKEAAAPRKHPAQMVVPERVAAPIFTPSHAPAEVAAPEKVAEPMTVEAMDAEIAKLVVE